LARAVSLTRSPITALAGCGIGTTTGRPASSWQSAATALITLILTSRAPNDCSIVPMFYRILVRSNEGTVLSYRRGPTLSRSVEQMFEVQDRNR
jgi:hypothetical protein